jgi:spore coat polysaccharide biosynthesis protein SpsF
MKIGLLITARLKSSRLPMKLLMDLNGRSVVERVIDRAKQIAGVDTIVLCTSTNAQDKPLVDVAMANDVYYYLGDPDDVLKRLLDAAKFFGLDYILSITGENPLFSLEYANRVVDDIKSKRSDFTFYEGLPLGCAVSGIKTKALEVVCSVKKEVDTEIWGPLINRPDIFSVSKGEVDPYYKRPAIRITNDYLEDYMFLTAIFQHFDASATPSLLQVLKLFDEKPELLKIHEARKQAYLSDETLQRINEFFEKNKDSILKLKSEIYSAL